MPHLNVELRMVVAREVHDLVGTVACKGSMAASGIAIEETVSSRTEAETCCC